MNEWERVLQINPKKEELRYYLARVKEYLKNEERLAKEKEIEERVKQAFDAGTAAFNSKLWISCIKAMEDVQKTCRNQPFPRALEWSDKAQGYIVKSVEQLAAGLAKNRKVRAVPQVQENSQAAEIDSEGAEKKYTEGLVLFAQGKLFDAMKCWEVAVRLNPGHEKALKAIERAKQR